MASDSDALAKEISRLKVTWDMKATLFLECTCTYGFIKYSTFIGRVNVPPPSLVAFELLLVYSQLWTVWRPLEGLRFTSKENGSLGL